MSELTADDGEKSPEFIEAEPAQPIGHLKRVSRTDRARSAGYRSRFALIYLGLALLAGGAAGGFLVQLMRADPAPPAPWSAWRPTGSEIAEVRQIADHVAKRYRLAGGQQLAAALPSTPKVSGATGDLAVSVIAIRPDTSTGKKEESEIDIVPAENSIQFILCGLGAGCSIKGGTASTARHALLRREALELALYTFKYVDGVDSVSVFLPPRPDDQVNANSVFLKRGDVREQLSKPLAASIGPKAPTVGKMPSAELKLVNRITQPRLYTYEYQQAQDGSAILIYNPIILGA